MANRSSLIGQRWLKNVFPSLSILTISFPAFSTYLLCPSTATVFSSLFHASKHLPVRRGRVLLRAVSLVAPPSHVCAQGTQRSSSKHNMQYRVKLFGEDTQQDLESSARLLSARVIRNC
ncbi:unnamed protein product, partial [Ectocarpus sp. 12 AP-2014]